MNDVHSAAHALLINKLSPPALTPSQIIRAGVRRLVSTSSPVKLILACAPAGFGKTTAMAQWRADMERQGVDTAWLTLDSADNDASRFLDCLDAVVSRLDGEADDTGYAALSATPFSVSDGALRLIDRLTARTTPFALFLDDFEWVQDPMVLRLVRELIEHLPRCGQIVIGSRSLPDVGLGRLRGRGQLLEIDAGHLRFSLEETAEFLAKRRLLPLPETTLSGLHRKTEGWIAALSLASAALEGRDGGLEFITRFSGSDAGVAAYLAEEVLALQTPEVRDFLLRTSILRHLNASLCEALAPHCQAGDMLAQLESTNLFIAPIEGEERTWRYHSLFADFLRAQLSRDMPGELTRLHLAASCWYETQGRPVPAIDHALDGGAYPRALLLLDKHAQTLLEEGRMRLLARWFATLPETMLTGHAMLQVVHVWALSFTQGPAAAMSLLERSGCAHSKDSQVSAHVLTLRPLLLTMMDRSEDAYEVGRDTAARLPVSMPFTDSVLANEMAYSFLVMGRYEESYRLLDTARRRQARVASPFVRRYSESVEGMIALEEGQLRQAVARFRMAMGATPASAFNHTGGNAWSGVFYASALYETNEIGQAEHLLHVYVPLARDVGLPDHIILGYVILSRIAFCRGDIDQALHCLAELEAVGQERGLRRVQASARMERSRLFLMQGDVEGSRDMLERAADRSVWQRVRRLHLPSHDVAYLELAQCRWDIVFGDAHAALNRLEQEITMASHDSRQRRVLKLRVLRAMALARSGNAAAARTEMGELLKLTAGEGYMRMIVDEGPIAGWIVRDLAGTLGSGPGRQPPILTEYLERLLRAFGPLPEPEPEPKAATEYAEPAAALAEPMTARELGILQLLANGYSNNALAEKLLVTDSTVRTHLRSINAKLKAQNRTQAVAIARKLGLLR